MLFVWHLKLYGHNRHVMVGRLKPRISKLKWRTSKNFHDCGVFTMLHMESFNGETASKWDCGLSVESGLQCDLLRRLRFKFATKILLHEINVHSRKKLELSNEFDKVDSLERMAIIVEAVKNKRN
nr:ulp1 protease family, C-terminal catalytic domain-containing protein [Tanacetum cinerariifolium]